MIARFRLKLIAKVMAGVAVVVLAVLIANAVWQHQQFWSDCQALAQGNGQQSWYQGVFVSFGFPNEWQGGNCRTQASQEHLKFTSRTSLVWLNGLPMNANTLIVTTEDRGERTLAKTLAETRQQPFAGQRDYDTTRVDGHDALLIVDHPDKPQHQQMVTAIIDKDDRRYIFHWTVWAWTNRQLHLLSHTSPNSDTQLEAILATVRLP